MLLISNYFYAIFAILIVIIPTVVSNFLAKKIWVHVSTHFMIKKKGLNTF